MSKLNENTLFVNSISTSIPISTYALINHAPDMMRAFTEYVYKFIRQQKEDANLFIKWLSSSSFFGQNMFVMHKSKFIEFENEIMKSLTILYPMIFPFPNVQDRNAGFILERAAGFVLQKMALKYNMNVINGHYKTFDNVTF